MRVLVACEESQTVCGAFRAKTYTGWAEAMAEQWGCLMTGKSEETYKEE